VRRTGPPAAGHPVQQVDVQRAGVHARRAADPRLAGRRVPAAVELQHEVLRVAERQVPGRRGAPVRHQSVPPDPGRSAAAPTHRRPPGEAGHQPTRRHDGVLGRAGANAALWLYTVWLYLSRQQ